MRRGNASGTYHALIVSHRSFEFLPVSDKRFGELLQKEVEALEAAILEAKAEKGDSRRLVKELLDAGGMLLHHLTGRDGRS